MKIRIKSGDCPSYLTVGKVYEVTDTYEFEGAIIGGYIVTDDGLLSFVSFERSARLNGGSWEIVND